MPIDPSRRTSIGIACGAVAATAAILAQGRARDSTAKHTELSGRRLKLVGTRYGLREVV